MVFAKLEYYCYYWLVREENYLQLRSPSQNVTSKHDCQFSYQGENNSVFLDY